MTNNTIEERRSEQAIGIAVDTRKFEIENFWRRSAFFWAFIGAAFVGFVALEDERIFQTVIAGFGFVASVAWTLQNRGSKYWQEAWEQKVRRMESATLKTDMFSREEDREPKGWWGGRKFSVSKLAIAMSDFTAAVWLILLISCYGIDIHITLPEPAPTIVQVLLGILAVGYVALLLIFGGMSPPKSSSSPEQPRNNGKDT